MIFGFDAPQTFDAGLAGGKAANLGRLTGAGFPVPLGFVVGTSAYTAFAEAAGLPDLIARTLAGIDPEDSDRLDRAGETIRAAFTEAPLPADLSGGVLAAYAALGTDAYVAVRSSGTAEDLAEASFAGLHDTYLDVRGEGEVLGAVRRCWASLWTARAIAYRQSRGFDRASVALAVVVQLMVEPEVAGVMFTANPATTATDEIVINANWGLGESVVAGIATPDQFEVKSGTLKVLDRRLGAKERRVVRAPGGSGTVVEATPADLRDALTLNDEQLRDLAQLGREVEQHYGGIPQDIEWALAGSDVYLLQARPITGVELSWDVDVDGWQPAREDDEVVWSRQMADEVWTGAITPLMYSWRAYIWTNAHNELVDAWELEDIRGAWQFKFWKAEAYYNTKVMRGIVGGATPPLVRPALLPSLPPDEREPALADPFSLIRHLQRYWKVQWEYPKQRFHNWAPRMDEVIAARWEESRGLPDAELRRLSDRELERYCQDMIHLEGRFFIDFWFPFFIYSRDVFSLLAWMVASWSDVQDPMAAVEMTTGMPRRTLAIEENLWLIRLAEQIRSEPELHVVFDAHTNGAFFERLGDSERGRAWQAEYAEFLTAHEHRGHADRDMYFARRGEDPSIDYQAFRALLSAPETLDAETREADVNARREAYIEQVLAGVRRRPFGELRAQTIRWAVNYSLEFLYCRENERYYVDRTTLTIKRGFQEIGRRIRRRGLIDEERDFYFLAKEELYDLLRGRVASLPLVKAKIAGRKRDFDRFNAREQIPPPYLHRGRGLDLDAAAAAGDGGMTGLGTSRGTVTGIARVVSGLHEIGRVGHGEILVCNATDPGWTPVFVIIAGLVLETGGILAHGSLLSREYGLPAVQLPGATARIPDGATITVNGDSGLVTIVDEVAASAT
jgi:rifampicin phosphotransferase